MLTENAIADVDDPFDLDSLVSEIPQKTRVALQLTQMASGLYRLVARTRGGKYATAKASTLARKFVRTSARIEIGPERVQMRIGLRACNSHLIQTSFADNTARIPWLYDLPLQFTFV